MIPTWRGMLDTQTREIGVCHTEEKIDVSHSDRDIGVNHTKGEIGGGQFFFGE